MMPIAIIFASSNYRFIQRKITTALSGTLPFTAESIW
jgi:hypothetical protein